MKSTSRTFRDHRATTRTATDLEVDPLESRSQMLGAMQADEIRSSIFPDKIVPSRWTLQTGDAGDRYNSPGATES
jgi:hypothetical protein